MFSVQLLDSPQIIERKIQEVCDKLIVRVLNGLSPDRILERFKPLVIKNIEASQTYQDIIGEDSELRGALGVPEPEPTLKRFINILLDNLDYSVNKNNLTFVLLRPGYEGIADEAAFQIQNEGPAGGVIPWLKWMLTAGDSIIIKDYQVKFGNYTNKISYGKPVSRTGLAVMVEETGSFWSIPPEYHAFVDKNFVTEAIESLEQPFFEIVKDEIKQGFSRA